MAWFRILEDCSSIRGRYAARECVELSYTEAAPLLDEGLAEEIDEADAKHHRESASASPLTETGAQSGRTSRRIKAE